MYWKALKRLICGCSIALAAAMSAGSDVETFRATVEGASSSESLQTALENAPTSLTDDVQLGVIRHLTDLARSGTSWEAVRQELLEDLSGRIVMEFEAVPGEVADAQQQAEQILSSPVYADYGEKEGRNWLDRLGRRLGEIIAAFLDKLFGQAPQIDPLLPVLPFAFLTTVAWVLLAIVLLVALIFVLMHVKIRARRKRVGGILEEDEPERTASEWLDRANDLEAEGRYREAVRCLYIASLVRFDESNVAKFIRHETNWEHLYRIEASPKMPEEADFRKLTQSFDLIWYGNLKATTDDVHYFKEKYITLCRLLGAPIAA